MEPFGGAIKFCTRSSKIVKCLEAAKPFALLLGCVSLGDTRMIVCKGEEVTFSSKSDGDNRADEIGMDVLVGSLRSLLWRAIILFVCFRSLTHPCIIDKLDVMSYQMFLESRKVQLSEPLMPSGEVVYQIAFDEFSARYVGRCHLSSKDLQLRRTGLAGVEGSCFYSVEQSQVVCGWFYHTIIGFRCRSRFRSRLEVLG